jgi:predicted RNase H-like nuclease (RuvC/YqgF family)
MSKQKKALVVGIDPGSTSAVAAVDLDGEIELLESGKNFPPSEIIERIVKVGRPVVIASDKGKTPSTVQDIGSSLGAELFEPEEDLESERKKELGKGANSHEKDAVASAVYAFNNLQRKIRKIEKYEKKLDIERPEVAKRYFSDRPLEPERDEEETETAEEVDESSEVERDREKQRLRRKIDNLEGQVESLKSELGEEKQKKEKLRQKYEDLKEEKRDEIVEQQEIRKREGIIKDRNQEIAELEEELENAEVRERQYREAIRKLRDGAEIVPIVDERTEDVPDRAVTRSEEILEKLRQRGFNIHRVEEVDGLELKHHHVVDKFPDSSENFEEIIKEYRESR